MHGHGNDIPKPIYRTETVLAGDIYDWDRVLTIAARLKYIRYQRLSLAPIRPAISVGLEPTPLEIPAAPRSSRSPWGEPCARTQPWV